MPKQVFSFETDREKDLQTLANAKAFCNMMLEHGFCSQLSCPNCETGKEIEACMQELPACDRLQVKQLTAIATHSLAFKTGALDKSSKAGKAIKGAASAAWTFIYMSVLCFGGAALFIWIVTRAVMFLSF